VTSKKKTGKSSSCEERPGVHSKAMKGDQKHHRKEKRSCARSPNFMRAGREGQGEGRRGDKLRDKGGSVTGSSSN